MTEMTIFNVQRAITQKVSKPDLHILVFCRSPHCASNSCKVNKYIIETIIFDVKDS